MLEILLLWLTVWFNGVPANCVVDTGSAYTVVAQSVADRIGTLAPATSEISLVAANGGTITGSVHRVANIGTQYLGWQDGDIVVLPDGQLDPRIPCIVGMNLLGRQRLILDWRAGQLLPASDAAGATVDTLTPVDAAAGEAAGSDDAATTDAAAAAGEPSI